MAPIRVNDGLWTNVEDEILKAAIAKYGLNQWSRVSSLLTRKNASQCKLRWQEWLDPRIKKHEWSMEEDRQLLNLANLRPNQWSSISLILNRTANQCIERYQELLTDHTSLEEMLDPNDKTEATRLLLTGNIENSGLNKSVSHIGGTGINHESMPSRPDDDELNEDEKEMIMETKARLANTQGKKAKRKARERILEESKHIAELLRRRELKQVGLKSKMKFKKKYANQMDYTADIAFERRPEKGPFDTSDELSRNIKETLKFDKTTQSKGTFNQEIAALKRKEKKRQEQNKKFEKLQENRFKRSYDDINDDEKYAEEFAKRRKFTFSDEIPTEDIDNMIESTIQTIKDKNTGKSLVFSRKQVDEVDAEDSIDSFTARKKEKEAKKKRKEEKKHLLETLSSLAEAEDDFDVNMDDLASDQPVLSIAVKKPKPECLIIDKTEQRRHEKKRLEDLRMQVKELETPQSIKRQLPTFNTFSARYPGDDEIDAMVLKLTQGRIHQFDSDNIEDLEKTIAVWNEVDRKIDSSMSNDSTYEKLLQVGNTSKLDTETSINMIKFYTEQAVEIEHNIKSMYNTKRSALQIDTQLNKINKLKTDIDTIDSEAWVYQRFDELESQAIEIRKERIQKELDMVNTLIERAKYS